MKSSLHRCPIRITTNVIHDIFEKIITNLFWDLAEVVDESNGSGFFKWVINVVDVHLALIEEMVEDIHCLHRWRTLLLVTKDQVDPFMQMGADIVTLQSLKKKKHTHKNLFLEMAFSYSMTFRLKVGLGEQY